MNSFSLLLIYQSRMDCLQLAAIYLRSVYYSHTAMEFSHGMKAKIFCGWSPEPRFVLFPDELKVSKSMQQLLKKNAFTFTINKAFKEVIDSCKTVSRRNQASTWITEEMKNAYINLHNMSYAHSAEVWLNDELVGGLYGIRLGKVFFGESMFSKVSNASKYAFINYVYALLLEGVKLIDCQVYTEHLESLGARMIEREKFVQLLKDLIN